MELATFIHPGGAYRLQYPAEWEFLTKDDGQSCGFGPRSRDDVGLWITILPLSIDADAIEFDLPSLFRQAIHDNGAGVRTDTTLRHLGLKADISKDDEGGHYWMIVGGDLVLFASSQVPSEEREIWNPPFDQLISSLEITRGRELLQRKTADEVYKRLCELNPQQEYRLEADGIYGRDHRISLVNLFRQVEASPGRRLKLIADFVDGLTSTTGARFGHEPLDEIREEVLPLLKPAAYLKSGEAAARLVAAEWLADVVICYAIRTKRIRRLITGADLDRWEISREALHQLSIDNLARLPWPERLEGARQEDGGRLIMISTNDSFDASRLLHPDLHRMFAAQLGNPFYAGVPDSETLVVFSAGNRTLLDHVLAQLRRDYEKSAYPITPEPFLVTSRGIRCDVI